MNDFWPSVWAIVRKDIRLERRTGQTISIMLFFSLSAVVTFNLALEGDLGAVRNVAGGLLWVTIVLAATLGLNRAIGSEQDNRAFDALRMAPIPRTAIYAGKLISSALFTLVLELILLFVFFIFTNRPFLQLPVLGVLFLGTIGYLGAGVLITSMTVQTRSRDVLLPVLLLPLSLPVVLAAASATATMITLNSYTWSDIGFSVSLVLLYDLLIITSSFFTFPFVIDE